MIGAEDETLLDEAAEEVEDRGDEEVKEPLELPKEALMEEERGFFLFLMMKYVVKVTAVAIVNTEPTIIKIKSQIAIGKKI
jgi:hypothetical protein